jgi:hypothetical protein
VVLSGVSGGATECETRGGWRIRALELQVLPKGNNVTSKISVALRSGLLRLLLRLFFGASFPSSPGTVRMPANLSAHFSFQESG